MSVSSSDFYRKITALEEARKDGIVNLAAKGVQISPNSSIPAVMGGIEAIAQGGNTTTINVNTSGDRIIYAAELPNTTFKLYNSDNILVQTLTNDASVGGPVAFTVSANDTYTVKAYDNSNTELWTSTITVSQIGQHFCKSGKAINDYTWEELQKISTGNYGSYMFKCDGTEYKQTNFMNKGATSDYAKAYLVDITDEGYLMFSYLKFNTTYKHWDSAPTNINGISWIGSKIRTNCLKVGDVQYIYQPSVTASTSGTYYKYNKVDKIFEQVVLPDDYVNTEKYYTRTVIATEGAFLTSLKAQLGNDSNGNQIMPRQRTIKTWGGCGQGITASSDTTVIETVDLMWLPSDSEIFGDSERTNNISKWALEGRTYKAFEKYREKMFYFGGGNGRWLRSPYVSSGSYFCCWNSNGYVYNYTASPTYCAPVCFCI